MGTPFIEPGPAPRQHLFCAHHWADEWHDEATRAIYRRCGKCGIIDDIPYIDRIHLKDGEWLLPVVNIPDERFAIFDWKWLRRNYRTDSSGNLLAVEDTFQSLIDWGRGNLYGQG